ncbi:hypothetical protein E0Z10_g5463 [Xylaria hypoxylon]|uniref:Uncharacterized protein n=1 Tax=Xylaria hypoxylon TaxID=37992 RepID=A0A4Z0YG56_9PEZI|nr:hypothetical protein E0Z10_g5463 [Xylaria hypoxylon]
MATNPMANNQAQNNSYAMLPYNPAPVPAPQVTEVYNQMRGFLKSTHWSKPYYSALVHNNPQLPYHLLEHVNCTYLSTPGRAPTLLALKQHAQSLAVLISMLAPAQYGGTFEPPNEGKVNADAPFAAEQAFDWLNNLQVHYDTEDGAHKKPLNALANLIKSNSDTEGPKWHCPLDKTDIEFPEKHPFQQYRPYESHLTLLMHANELLERLDHEYSAMGGILSIIPLDSENVDEGRALKQAKTTLVGQWILYTQHLVVRMHELEIAYGNSLDLLANEAVVPMQHMSVHGPDGRSGREIVFPQDRWILANAGEDVFTFIHQMLDRAETHQDAKDDAFAEQNVLGDAAYSRNNDLKYRGIVKADLNTRFYRLRGSGHGPLFVLPAFGDRANTKHTRDIESRPTVLAIPQPDSKEAVNSWESKHKDVETKLLRLSVQNSNLEAQVSQLHSSVQVRDLEINRLTQFQKQYDDKISTEDKNLGKNVVYLNESIKYYQKVVREGAEREAALKQDIQNFKNANVSAQNGENPVNNLIVKVNDQQSQILKLEKEITERDNKIEDISRDKEMLQILMNPSLNNSSSGSPAQVAQLKEQLASSYSERQMLLQEIHNLKKAKVVKGKIFNFPEGFKLEYGSTFEDTNQGITACSTTFYNALLAAERERNDHQLKLDNGTINTHTLQEQLDKYKAEAEKLRKDNVELRSNGNAANPSKVINIPWRLQYTSTFRDDNQGLIVLTTQWYDYLVEAEKSASDCEGRVAELNKQIENLKTPVEANLANVYSFSKGKLAQTGAYRDTKQNIAVLTLSYFDELQKTDQAKNATQQQLDEYQKNAQTLQQHLDEARKQLNDCMTSQKSADVDLPNLQNERDQLLNELKRALERCLKLEEQVINMSTGKPASNLESQALTLQKQVKDFTKKVEEKESEIVNVQARYNNLLLNEINLRAEVANLRQQLSDAKKGAATKPGNVQPPGSGHDELQSTEEELELYKAELATLQSLWNDLQTQHVIVQTQLENAEENCDEEKAHLQQKLNECKLETKVLQMKVIADPNKLQPVIIEMEAQRDAAWKQRDGLREEIKALRQQLQLQK